MREIIEEKINRVLNEKEFQWFFNTEEDGLYGVEVVASCKSWRQNFSIQDDGLAVKIDHFSFPQKKDSKKLFDGEAAWNGNNSKGLKKTGFFILPLKAGPHTVTFLVHKQPFLESIRIFQIEEKEFYYLPQDNPPEDGNRRQWFTIVLGRVGLGSVFVVAQAQPGQNYPNFFHDDGDLKIVIDGIIQKNYEKKSHKNWYWCGRGSKGEPRQLFQQLDFKPDLHYLEFYADRSPIVQSIAINFGDNIQTQEMFLPRAKVIAKEANLRTKPFTASDVLAFLKKGDEVLIIEKAKPGEAPYKKLGDFTNIWHRVKFQGKEGYIFAKFLEIQGEDKDTIRAKIIKISEKYEQNPCLMLAIAQRESQFFPYAVSNVDARGLFQLTEIAVQDIIDKFLNKEVDRFDVDQSIEAGVLYFKKLTEIYQYGEDKANNQQKQLAAWNIGQGKIFAKKYFDLKKQPKVVRIFIKDVLSYQRKCEEQKEKQGGKIRFSLLTAGAYVLLLVALFFLLLNIRKIYWKECGLPVAYEKWVILEEKHLDINGDGRMEKLVAIIDKLNTTFSTSKVILLKGGKLFETPNSGGNFLWWQAGDFNKNKKIELLVVYDNYGNKGYKSWYLYEWQGDNFELILNGEEILPEIVIKDLDGDGIAEIKHTFSASPGEPDGLEVFKWDEASQKYLVSK